MKVFLGKLNCQASPGLWKLNNLTLMNVLDFGEVHITTRRLEFKYLSSKLERTGEVTAFLDGDNGLGQVSVWHAMSHAIEITKDYGLSLVGF